MSSGVVQVPTAVEEHVGSKWKEVLPVNGTEEEQEALREKVGAVPSRSANELGRLCHELSRLRLTRVCGEAVKHGLHASEWGPCVLGHAKECQPVYRCPRR